MSESIFERFFDISSGLSPEVISSLIVMGIICVFAVIVGILARKADPLKKPKGLLLLVEWAVEKLDGFEIIPPDLNTEKHQSLDGLSINCSVIISGNPEAVNFCEYFIDDVNIAVCSHDNIETKIEEIRL